MFFLLLPPKERPKEKSLLNHGYKPQGPEGCKWGIIPYELIGIVQLTNFIMRVYKKRYNNEFEFMFVFSKGLMKTHNPIMVDCTHAGLKLNGTTYKRAPLVIIYEFN
jgi:hypothetical protein